jgi:hypothetical protein
MFEENIIKKKYEHKVVKYICRLPTLIIFFLGIVLGGMLNAYIPFGWKNDVGINILILLLFITFIAIVCLILLGYGDNLELERVEHNIINKDDDGVRIQLHSRYIKK